MACSVESLQKYAEKAADSEIFCSKPVCASTNCSTPALNRAPDELATGSPAWLRDELGRCLAPTRCFHAPPTLFGMRPMRVPTVCFPKWCWRIRLKMFVPCSATPKSEISQSRCEQREQAPAAKPKATAFCSKSSGTGWCNRGRRLTTPAGETGNHSWPCQRCLVRPRLPAWPRPSQRQRMYIGGVIANNSSGMCCGTVQDSYQTLESLIFLLPSGTLIDTAAPQAEQQFAAAEPALVAGLFQIKGEIEVCRCSER